ncbi:MAG: hypothetical protein ACW972_05930 [Promethearchaeota archaeon]|jgi:hypothetical protein
MNEKNKNLEKNHHPKIIESEEKEIEERKPPNDKIISFNLINKDSKD